MAGAPGAEMWRMVVGSCGLIDASLSHTRTNQLSPRRFSDSEMTLLTFGLGLQCGLWTESRDDDQGSGTEKKGNE